MSESNDEKLYLPTRKVLSLDDAREAEEEKKRPRKPSDKDSDFVTRAWAKETFGKTAVSIGQQMYTQVSGELADHLEAMEDRMRQQVRREIYLNSWRGRLHRFLIEHGLREKPPQLVAKEVVAALDPQNAQEQAGP